MEYPAYCRQVNDLCNLAESMAAKIESLESMEEDDK